MIKARESYTNDSATLRGLRICTKSYIIIFTEHCCVRASLVAGISCHTFVAGPSIWFGSPALRAKCTRRRELQARVKQCKPPLFTQCQATLSVSGGAKTTRLTKRRSVLMTAACDHNTDSMVAMRGKKKRKKNMPHDRLRDRSVTLLHRC